MEYKIDIKGIENLLKKVDSVTQKDVIKQSLYKSAIFITGWIKERRLTGPRPKFLGVKSGRLRSSITASPTVQEGNEYITKIGTNVEYAPIHEFGGVIHRNPRSSLFIQNRFSRGSKKGRFKKGSTRGRGFTFQGYDVTIPSRPFLRPGIEDKDNQKRVLTILVQNINKALAK